MMTDAEKLALKTATDRVTALEGQIADGTRLAHTAAATSFVDGLIVAKKLDPAKKAETVATYMAMAACAPIEFAGADGATVKQSPLDGWKKQLEAAAPVLNTAETTPPDGKTKLPTARGFVAPAGTTVDAESAELHNKVLAFQAKSGEKDYSRALAVVMDGGT